MNGLWGIFIGVAAFYYTHTKRSFGGDKKKKEKKKAWSASVLEHLPHKYAKSCVTSTTGATHTCANVTILRGVCWCSWGNLWGLLEYLRVTNTLYISFSFSLSLFLSFFLSLFSLSLSIYLYLSISEHFYFTIQSQCFLRAAQVLLQGHSVKRKYLYRCHWYSWIFQDLEFWYWY